MEARETEQNSISFKGRIKILEDDEIEEIYGLPRFYSDERTYYFSLTQKEREIVNSYRTLENQILFILQAGYFKAKIMFFSFEFKDVQDDVRDILKQHFSINQDNILPETILRQTRYLQRKPSVKYTLNYSGFQF